MPLPAALKKKVGPLPVAGWGVIVVGGLGGAYLYRRWKGRASGSLSSPEPEGGLAYSEGFGAASFLTGGDGSFIPVAVGPAPSVESAEIVPEPFPQEVLITQDPVQFEPIEIIVTQTTPTIVDDPGFPAPAPAPPAAPQGPGHASHPHGHSHPHPKGDHHHHPHKHPHKSEPGHHHKH